MNSWIIALLVIAFLILVHEFGHFIAAKWMKVRVEEFSVGFPPRLISKIIGHTKYSIGLILVGGYVRMRGQNIEDENPNEPDNYVAKNPWQRMVIVLAGPLINILLAIIIMPFAYKLGFNVPSYLVNAPAIIDSVSPTSQAEKLGFQSGDQIISINNLEVTNWEMAYEILGEDQSINEVKVKNINEVNSKTRNIPISNQLTLDINLGITPLIPPVLGSLRPGWPAEIAGLLPGDTITKLGDKEVRSISMIANILAESKNNPLSIEYLRPQENGNQSIRNKTTIIARLDNNGDVWRLGFSFATVKKYYSWPESIKLGWQNNVRLTNELFKFFKKLFRAEVSKNDVGGPIMIVKVISDASSHGISSLIIILAFISFQLGVFNLLPFPVLDGGHLVLLIAELITGKQLSAKARTRIQLVGIIFLVGLMIFVTFQDILRL